MAVEEWLEKALGANLCSCLAFSCGLSMQVSSPTQCAPQRLASDLGCRGTTWVALPSKVWAMTGSPENFRIRTGPRVPPF